ncbi:MAG TPA: undecaprenyl-phosphate glucose phosphotransferase [Pedobacter sp.]|nr:undecaprenyl-phosphate glucose phosphotransferase [Pedobacter sp.]
MFIQTRYVFIISYILPVTDIIMLNALYMLAAQLTGGHQEILSHETTKNYLIVCNLIWLSCSAAMSLYTVSGNQKVEKLYVLTIKSLLLHLLMFGAYFYISEATLRLTLQFAVVFYLLFFCVFIISRFFGSAFHDIFLNRDRATKKVAILGSNNTALRFSSFLQNQRNLDFYGFLGNDDSLYAQDREIVSPDVVKRFQEAARDGVTDVYVAVSPERLAEVDALLSEAERHCLRLKFIPDLSSSITYPYSMSYIGNEFPVISVRHEPLEEIGNRFWKRVFDITFSLFVIVAVFSWLFPLVAFLIKLCSNGPVFFKQLRSGRNDQPFWCYKFRTMDINENSDSKQAEKNDHRITKIGSILRKTSLDELPQFFNVLLGDMSVIGPRPHMLKHTYQYRQVISHFMVRHYLKPGITGWAQVNGFRGETRENKDMEGRVRHDIFYLENWTVMLDIKIIIKTILNVVKGEENAY